MRLSEADGQIDKDTYRKTFRVADTETETEQWRDFYYMYAKRPTNGKTDTHTD